MIDFIVVDRCNLRVTFLAVNGMISCVRIVVASARSYGFLGQYAAVFNEHRTELVRIQIVLLAIVADGGKTGRAAQDCIAASRSTARFLLEPFFVPIVEFGVIKRIIVQIQSFVAIVVTTVIITTTTTTTTTVLAITGNNPFCFRCGDLRFVL